MNLSTKKETNDFLKSFSQEKSATQVVDELADGLSANITLLTTLQRQGHIDSIDWSKVFERGLEAEGHRLNRFKNAMSQYKSITKREPEPYTPLSLISNYLSCKKRDRFQNWQELVELAIAWGGDRAKDISVDDCPKEMFYDKANSERKLGMNNGNTVRGHLDRFIGSKGYELRAGVIISTR